MDEYEGERGLSTGAIESALNLATEWWHKIRSLVSIFGKPL